MSQVENIDKTQLEKYLENPDHCPFCGSDAIEGNGIEIIFDIPEGLYVLFIYLVFMDWLFRLKLKNSPLGVNGPILLFPYYYCDYYCDY